MRICHLYYRYVGLFKIDAPVYCRQTRRRNFFAVNGKIDTVTGQLGYQASIQSFKRTKESTFKPHMKLVSSAVLLSLDRRKTSIIATRHVWICGC